MNVSLPAELKDFVERRTSSGCYGSSSEYVRALIRRDLGLEQFRNMILEGMNSPVVAVADDEYFDSLRELARKAGAERRRASADAASVADADGPQGG